MFAIVVALWRRAARSGDDVGRLDGVAPLGAVLAFLLCSPLLSPQYLVWLLPFAAISWAHGHRAVAAVAGAGIVATMVLVRTYQGLWEGTFAAHAVVLGRNALLVIGLGVAWHSLRRSRVAATRPVRPVAARVPVGAVPAAQG
jgi:hypothetical protein